MSRPIDERCCCNCEFWGEIDEGTGLVKCENPKRKRCFYHNEEFVCKDYKDWEAPTKHVQPTGNDYKQEGENMYINLFDIDNTFDVASDNPELLEEENAL